MTQEQKEKLPKFAQKYIRKIERERDNAITKLNEYCDNQTKSAFYSEDICCTGEKAGISTKRCYIQAYSLNVEANGIHVNIRPNDRGIEIQYDNPDRSIRELALIPESFQKIRITTKENLRA